MKINFIYTKFFNTIEICFKLFVIVYFRGENIVTTVKKWDNCNVFTKGTFTGKVMSEMFSKHFVCPHYCVVSDSGDSY